MPRPDISGYDVYVWNRGRPKAVRTGQTLGADALPATFEHKGKTYHWSATDDVERLVIFSEADPRASV